MLLITLSDEHALSTSNIYIYFRYICNLFEVLGHCVWMDYKPPSKATECAESAEEKKGCLVWKGPGVSCNR